MKDIKNYLKECEKFKEWYIKEASLNTFVMEISIFVLLLVNYIIILIRFPNKYMLCLSVECLILTLIFSFKDKKLCRNYYNRYDEVIDSINEDCDIKAEEINKILLKRSKIYDVVELLRYTPLAGILIQFAYIYKCI